MIDVEHVPELTFHELKVRAGWHETIETFTTEGSVLIGAAISDASYEREDQAFSNPPLVLLDTLVSSTQLFVVDRDNGRALWQDEPGAPIVEHIVLPDGWLPSDPKRHRPDGHRMPRDNGLSLDWFSVTLENEFEVAALRYRKQWLRHLTAPHLPWSEYFDPETCELRRCTERCGWLFADGHYLAPPSLIKTRTDVLEISP